MSYFLVNIEAETTKNTDYRRVIFTSHYIQLVLMSLKPGEEIGNEQHGLDQFIRIEAGEAKLVLDNGAIEHTVSDDWAVVIPAGTWHNLINIGTTDLKLYTLYSPPEHRLDVIQAGKADERDEHFDGQVNR